MKIDYEFVKETTEFLNLYMGLNDYSCFQNLEIQPVEESIEDGVVYEYEVVFDYSTRNTEDIKVTMRICKPEHQPGYVKSDYGNGDFAINTWEDDWSEISYHDTVAFWFALIEYIESYYQSELRKMIPLRYQKASYENDVPENIKALMRDLKAGGKGIYLHGTVGTGKTHIAYSIKKKWDAVSPTLISTMWNTTELFGEIKEEFSRDYMNKKRTVENLNKNKGLLILDDIGAEKPTEFVQETFYLLINKRYNDMTPTIFTSNCTIAELSARLGDRIASRITEMSNFVRLDGTDRRLPK